MNGIIYLVYVREFLVQDVPIYKIGKTQDICTRLKQYPKGSILVYSCYNDDITKTENEIIKLFSVKFIQRKDLGSESFEGDLQEMIALMHAIVNFKKSNIIKPIEKKKENNIIDKYDKDALFTDNVTKFVENEIKDHDDNFLHLKTIMNLWNTRFPDYFLSLNIFSRIFQKHLGGIKSNNNKLGWPNKIFVDQIKKDDKDDDNLVIDKLNNDVLFIDNVINFIEKEIKDHDDNFLSLKTIMNLWNHRFSDHLLNQNNFSKIFQKYLGEIKSNNNKLGWPNKIFVDFIEKKKSDDNQWNEYMNNLLKDKNKFLYWKDLKKSFNAWLKMNRKNDSPKISEIKEYFNKQIGPWVHTTDANNKAKDGYRGWYLLMKPDNI